MEFQQKTPLYRLLVIGANGGIGRQCVELALEAGHQVTAVVRNISSLNRTHPNLEIVKGDIMSPETLKAYLENKDAVISAIGTKGGLLSDKPTNLYSHGNSNLLQLMQKAPVERVFFISASAIEISPVLPLYVQLITKYIIQKLLRHMYADIRIMEKRIRESNAAWTIIRPPQLTDKGLTGRYRIAVNAFLRNCLRISRADVAHFIINNIGNEAVYKAIVEIGY